MGTEANRFGDCHYCWADEVKLRYSNIARQIKARETTPKINDNSKVNGKWRDSITFYFCIEWSLLSIFHITTYPKKAPKSTQSPIQIPKLTNSRMKYRVKPAAITEPITITLLTRNKNLDPFLDSHASNSKRKKRIRETAREIATEKIIILYRWREFNLGSIYSPN